MKRTIVLGIVFIALLASVGAVSASTLNLVQKDGSWNPIPGASGVLTYTFDGSAFTFEGTNLPAGEYSLISYEDNNWPGANSILLGTGTAVNGNVHIEGTLNLVLNTYPNVPTEEYAGQTGAKIWLVPSSDFTEGTGLKWNPSAFLFETALINPGQIPVPEFPTMAFPAALIVGLIGAVLFVQKSKDQ